MWKLAYEGLLEISHEDLFAQATMVNRAFSIVQKDLTINPNCDFSYLTSLSGVMSNHSFQQIEIPEMTNQE